MKKIDARTPAIFNVKRTLDLMEMAEKESADVERIKRGLDVEIVSWSMILSQALDLDFPGPRRNTGSISHSKRKIRKRFTVF